MTLIDGAQCDVEEAQNFVAAPPLDDMDHVTVNFSEQECYGSAYA